MEYSTFCCALRECQVWVSQRGTLNCTDCIIVLYLTSRQMFGLVALRTMEINNGDTDRTPRINFAQSSSTELGAVIVCQNLHLHVSFTTMNRSK